MDLLHKLKDKGNQAQPRHRGLGGKFSRLVFTWMRKVVGLNPDDSLYRTVSFSFAEVEADTSIEKGDFEIFEIKEKLETLDFEIDF